MIFAVAEKERSTITRQSCTTEIPHTEAHRRRRARVASPHDEFLFLFRAGGLVLTRRATDQTIWRICSIVVILIIGAVTSIALLGYAGGGIDSAISGAGFWVTAPYLASCIFLVIARPIPAQKLTLGGVSLITGIGLLGYVDALFWSPDAQSALVFVMLPLAQVGLVLTFTVIAGIARYLATRKDLN